MGLFRFRRFEVDDCGCGQKVCSDSVLLGCWFFREYPAAGSVLDIGTGSGLLALMAADMVAGAMVDAVEIEPAAYEAAKSNFERSSNTARLSVTAGDFTALTIPHPYDLIVCNPPFFTTGARADDTVRATARHEGTLNVVSLMRFAARNLSGAGHMGLITPADREQVVLFEAELAGLTPTRMLRVSTSPRKPASRLLWDFARHSNTLVDQSLVIRDSANGYTDEYLALVKDQYLSLT